MSHLTTVSKIKVTDLEAFKLALAELGLVAKENLTIRAHDDKTIQVAVGCVVGGYGIGVVKNAEGKYDLVGDWQCFGWGLTNKFKKAAGVAVGQDYISDKQIQDCILKHTTKHALTRAAAKKGWRCRAVEDEVTGEIRLSLTR